MDVGTWKFLLKVIKKLGIDGMSSEESDDDGMFRVCLVPWRRDIAEYLQIIDNERSLNRKQFPRQGSKAVIRKREANAPKSKRKATPGLPRSFYDNKWLEEQGEEFVDVLETSEDEKWVWPSIKVTA